MQTIIIGRIDSITDAEATPQWATQGGRAFCIVADSGVLTVSPDAAKDLVAKLTVALSKRLSP